MEEKKKQDLPPIPHFRSDIFLPDEAHRPSPPTLPKVPQFREDVFLPDEAHRPKNKKSQDLPEKPEFRRDIFLEYGVDPREDFGDRGESKESDGREQSPEYVENRKKERDLPEIPQFRDDVFLDYGEGFQKDAEGLWKTEHEKEAEHWVTGKEFDPEEERRCNEVIAGLEGEYLQYERAFTIRTEEEIAQEWHFFKNFLPLPAFFMGEYVTMFHFWLCNLVCIILCQSVYILLTYWATEYYHYFSMVLVAFSGKFLGIFQVTTAVQVLRQLLNHKGDYLFYIFAAMTFHPLCFLAFYLAPMDLFVNLLHAIFS